MSYLKKNSLKLNESELTHHCNVDIPVILKKKNKCSRIWFSLHCHLKLAGPVENDHKEIRCMFILFKILDCCSCMLKRASVVS